MNSNDCKLKIKICYKDKKFEEESNDLIPLQKIKEKAIKEFDIIKEDEDFINFIYYSNIENKNHSIEKDNDIINYSEEESSGDLICNLELIINNPTSKMKENTLSNENKGEKIESKESNNDIIKIKQKTKTDIKEDEKEKYENEINQLKLDIEKITSEFTNLKKENSEKEKESEQIINNLKENIKNNEAEITNNKSMINNLSSMLEKTKKECENINNQKLQIENKYQNFNADWKKFLEKTDENYRNLLNKISKIEGVIEKTELNKNILDEYRSERNEEKKEKKENEKNKNIELIKEVIDQMKLDQNNEVIEKNKKLEEENKNLNNKIKEMENQNNKDTEEKLASIILVLNKMYEEMENYNKVIKKSINNIFDKFNEINENKKDIDNKIKSKKKFPFFSKKESNKNEKLNLKKEKEIEKNSLSIITIKEKSKIFQENNIDFLSDYEIYYKDDEIGNKNININYLDNKDIYNNLSEQLKIFYESNISKENILKILNKIKEIILLAQ